MNRTFKMFLLALVACWVVIIPEVVIRNYSTFKQLGTDYAYSYMFQAIFYSFPLIIVIFGLLVMFNAIMKYKAERMRREHWQRHYYLVGLLFVAVIPISLIVFEFTQRGRYLDDSDFYEKIYANLFLIGFGVAILFANKKLFWRT